MENLPTQRTFCISTRAIRVLQN